MIYKVIMNIVLTFNVDYQSVKDQQNIGIEYSG